MNASEYKTWRKEKKLETQNRLKNYLVTKEKNEMKVCVKEMKKLKQIMKLKQVKAKNEDYTWSWIHKIKEKI